MIRVKSPWSKSLKNSLDPMRRELGIFPDSLLWESCAAAHMMRVSNKTCEHLLHFKTASCPDDPLSRWAGMGVPAHPPFLRIPSFPMRKSCSWGGFRGGAVFAQISGSARTLRCLRGTSSSVTLLLEVAEVTPTRVGHV